MLSVGPEKINKEKYLPHQEWKQLKEKAEDPFTDSDSPKEIISTVLRSRKLMDPPSNGSDLDNS